MTLGRLVRRSLRYYWQTNLLVLVGLVISGAVITGSLVIGDSMRGSLRDTAVARLGTITHCLTAPRLVRAALARELPGGAAVLHTSGAAANADSEATVPGVTIWGVGPEFWTLYPRLSPPALSDQAVALNASLARDLRVQAGGEVLLTVNRPAQLGADSIFGHRRLEQVVETLRVTVAAVLPDGGAGDLRLDAQSARPRNAFVSYTWLAERLGQPGKASVLLAAVAPSGGGTPAGRPPDDLLAAALQRSATLDDYGLQVKRRPGSILVYSDALTLSNAQVEAVSATALASGATTRRSLVYLATSLRPVATPSRRASYAVIAGLDPAGAYPFHFVAGSAARPPAGDEVWLNDWLAADLQARPGDRIDLDYLVPAPDGTYPTRTKRLRVTAIVATSGPGADPGFMPDYKGLTDAAEMGEWQPPFPVELGRLTPRDEDYWRRYRAAPKAFLNLNTVRGMWLAASPATLPARPATCLEVVPPAGAEFAGSFVTRLLARLSPEGEGLRFQPLRKLALAASRGSSDFSGLFLGLSMFIVMSGAGLAAMLLRLAFERRAAQVGVMLAAGVPPAAVRWGLLLEGLLLATTGALLGVGAGVGYAAVLLRVLVHWWRGALGATPGLWLHVSTESLVGGLAGALAVGVVAAAFALRGLLRRPVLELLAGWQALREGLAAPSAALRYVLAVLLAAAAALLGLTLGVHLVPATAGFFALGFVLRLAAIVGVRLALGGGRQECRAYRGEARQECRAYLARGVRSLAWRNAAANPGRSRLVFGLLAGASFVIVAVAANTRDLSRLDTLQPNSGAGGFNLVATTAVPLTYDPATSQGRANLAIPPEDEALLAQCRIVSLLASPGEDISCLNLSRPQAPRLLALPPALSLDLWEGRRFGARVSPVRDAVFSSPTIDCFGDADSVMWTLHSGLDRLYRTRDVRGRELTLRLAGLLPGSIFAGELLIGEGDFRSLYPDLTAPSYFLITTPRGQEQAVAEVLRRDLGDLGLRVRPSVEILAEFGQVQNTYLSMFLALGGLGLLLGTFGMVIVLLRSVFERRRELALLLAVGFGEQRVGRLLLHEHVGLLAGGLGAGAAAALIAVAPQLLQAQSAVNWPALAAVLLLVAVVGLGSCLAAVRAALRGSLLDSLRRE